MDYIGMLGVSLVPDSKYPENADVIFLPTQAATDSVVVEKVEKSLNEGKKVVMTAGFLARVKNGEKLAQLAGIKYPLVPEQVSTQIILNEGKTDSLKFALQTDYRIEPENAEIVLQTAGNKSVPFLVRNKNMVVVSTHTFSQADFDAVGEVLLCPRQIGLTELPKSWLTQIRSSFGSNSGLVVDAPSKVAVQQLADGNFVVHNYNQEKTLVEISAPEGTVWEDSFKGQPLEISDNKIKMEIPPRSRVWLTEKIR